MRGRSPLESAVRSLRQLPRHRINVQSRRAVQISATPTTESPTLSADALSNAIDASTDTAGMFRFISCYKDVSDNWLLLDARFEVLGAPYSLLSVSLSASQKLYTRRGTLVGVSGKTENVSCYQNGM